MPRSITTNRQPGPETQTRRFKSSHEKSSSIRKTSGVTSSTTLFDSTITFSPRQIFDHPCRPRQFPDGTRSRNERLPPPQ
jgi:hypothetical protein